MAFCDAQHLHGFGPYETKVNNIYLQYILFFYLLELYTKIKKKYIVFSKKYILF